MLSKLSKIVVPGTLVAVMALTMTASAPEAFARGGHGGHGGHGHHGRGHGRNRGFGHYRNRGYFGYRNSGWGYYGGYAYPDYSYATAYVPVGVDSVCEAPACDATAYAPTVFGYPADGGYSGGFGWGRGYRGWGNRGGRGRGMRGGHGGHGGHGRR
jgi:hypothetical protein